MEQLSQLNHYKKYIDEQILESIYQKAKALRGIDVLHVNTTYAGGGVAEILKAFEPVITEFDIRHTRKIIELDEQASRFTSRLLALLQDNEPGIIPVAEQEQFVDWLRQKQLSVHDDQADIYCIHDFQLVPMASFSAWMRPAIWFCHVDTAQPNLYAKRYVLDYLSSYDLCVFNTALSVFPELSAEQVHVITLGIDPFRRKHAPLERAQGLKLLQCCGIDVNRPLITQVARYDRWKGPRQAIDIYRLVKKRLPSVQLAFVGAMEATDDKGAVHVLHELEQYAQGDQDIHFLSDPASVGDDEVNAFQRYSSVILQRSVHEGFGLTATEAMWKYQPVVGTSATGLQTQIHDGENGYCVDDTQEAAERVLTLLQQREHWQRLGQHAHEHVRTHYLLPMMLLDYLEALEKAVSRSRQEEHAVCARSVAD